MYRAAAELTRKGYDVYFGDGPDFSNMMVASLFPEEKIREDFAAVGLVHTEKTKTWDHSLRWKLFRLDGEAARFIDLDDKLMVVERPRVR